MTWLAILTTVLKLASALAGIVRERQLLNAGEQVAMAKALAATADRLKIGDQVRAEIEAMSDGDLDAALRGDK